MTRTRRALAVAALPMLPVILAGCGRAAPGPVRLPSPWASGGPPVVVTLGDSVPAGTGCDCTPFPDLYARRLHPPGISVNESQPGYTSQDVRDQLTDPGVHAALAAATVVLIMAGANDVAAAFDHSRDEAGFRAAAATAGTNVQAVVAAVRAARTPAPAVLVLGYWNVVKDGAAGRAAYGAAGQEAAVAATRDCNAALRRAAAASGARYVTTTPAFTGPQRDRDPTNLLAADGDHPNAAGHEAIAEAIHAALPEP